MIIKIVSKYSYVTLTCYVDSIDDKKYFLLLLNASHKSILLLRM